MGDFYGTGIEIWAGFGPVWQLLKPVFSCFHGQIFFFKFHIFEIQQTNYSISFEVYDGFIGQKI